MFLGLTVVGVVALFAPVIGTAVAGAIEPNPTASDALEPLILRLGTGSPSGTYYPMGTLLAKGLTLPGDEDCGQSLCGPGAVLVVAQASNGPVANLQAMERGMVELGIAQSNIVDWAYRGTGRFKGRAPADQLRAVATLYVEKLHLIVRKGAGVSSVADLRGRHVALDEQGTGTLEDVRVLLRAHGMTERDMRLHYIKPDLAFEHMQKGRLDALFLLAGSPVPILRSAEREMLFTLVPIQGEPVDLFLSEMPYHRRISVLADTYADVPETPTIGLGAQLLVRADLDEQLVYRLTQALWSDRMRAILDKGHEQGRFVRLETALDGIPIPLHPGAERFYREIGLVK